MERTDRIRCLVPFCNRSRKHDPKYSDEWICGPHWRQVPHELKVEKSKHFRTYRRRYGDAQPYELPKGSPERVDAFDIASAFWKAWERCKAAAIEAGAGI